MIRFANGATFEWNPCVYAGSHGNSAKSTVAPLNVREREFSKVKPCGSPRALSLPTTTFVSRTSCNSFSSPACCETGAARARMWRRPSSSTRTLFNSRATLEKGARHVKIVKHFFPAGARFIGSLDHELRALIFSSASIHKNCTKAFQMTIVQFHPRGATPMSKSKRILGGRMLALSPPDCQSSSTNVTFRFTRYLTILFLSMTTF